MHAQVHAHVRVFVFKKKKVHSELLPIKEGNLIFQVVISSIFQKHSYYQNHPFTDLRWLIFNMIFGITVIICSSEKLERCPVWEVWG